MQTIQRFDNKVIRSAFHLDDHIGDSLGFDLRYTRDGLDLLQKFFFRRMTTVRRARKSVVRRGIDAGKRMLDGSNPIVIATNRGAGSYSTKFNQDYPFVAMKLRENRTFLPMDQNLLVAQ